MTQWWEHVLRCPVCGASMHREGGSLGCTGARRHCFDIASAGYVNLAGAKASGGGDDAELIRARSAFLEQGHYQPIANMICEALAAYCPGGIVLDAGCGEGYYSMEMAKGGAKIIGIDLSKRGILHAAKRAKREGSDAMFAVAGIFELPLADACADAIVSLFAPVCETEFLRVLKPGGVLFLVGAGPEHLLSLKRVLYDTPYENEARADAPQSMSLLESKRLQYRADVAHDALQSLFAMTPYYYRTSKEGVARLDATKRLDVDIDVTLAVYRK